MAITDMFSKRQKMLRKEIPDVYVYDDIPQALRVQIVYILRDLYGHPQPYDASGYLAAFREIEESVGREYGEFSLEKATIGRRQTADERVRNFILQEPDHEKVLDVVERSFCLLPFFRNLSFHWQARVPKEKFDAAVNELNARFREHGIGYQYESGEIIRVDSQLIHAEVVKPALALLTAKEYAGANAEFLKAFGHYRKGEIKDCLSECLKAFESTMKAICTKRKWAFKATDAASTLIDVCLKNNLIPQLLQSHIGGVRAALESGIPTIRNRLSGHGQGSQIVDVPEQYASYMLHLTATTIKFLVESEKALPA
jgi:AbiJ N-terminal domain 4